jgi:hypothetical protein
MLPHALLTKGFPLMGNFYANVLVPEVDVARVVEVVEGLGRRALITGAGRAVFIYDAQCDDQDRTVIERLVGAVSSSCGTAWAVSNHDDDVLWYALAGDGRVIDTYDSNPGYLLGERRAPSGGDAALLTDTFGVPEMRLRVDALLRRVAVDGSFECERHAELLHLLGLPRRPAQLGYRYVSRGELLSESGAIELRGVGGAVLPSDPGRQRASAGDDPSAADASGGPFDSLRVNASYLALQRAEVEFDDRFGPVAGTGRMNAWLAMMKISYYATREGLDAQEDSRVVRCDALLAELLGVSEFARSELTVIAQRAFGVPSLTADELRESRDRSSSLGRAVADRARSLNELYGAWLLKEMRARAARGRGS